MTAKKTTTKQTTKKRAAGKGASTSKAAHSPAAKKAERHPAAKVAAEPAPAAARRKLPKAQLDDLRKMLLEMRERLTGQIASLKQDSLKREDSVNSSEDGTDAFDRQFALNLASSEREELFEIDEALRRIEEGNYGICEVCETAVEKPRLKALPFVRLCVKCQSEIERRTPRFRPASML